MSEYKQAKLRPLRVAALLLRGLAGLLAVWPLILISIFLLFPRSPHLRVQYSYVLVGSEKIMKHCEYLGSRGVISYMHGDQCPFVVMIDRR